MKPILATIALLLAMGCASGFAQQPRNETRYINQQLKIIEAHEKLLVAAGRITDAAHWQPELYLAEYGWHSSCGDSRGTAPIFCGGGAFGAYTFSEAAYQQAKRIYVIHGTVDAGTDILVDQSYGVMIPDRNGVVWSGSPIGKGAFDSAIVGDSVGSLTYCQGYGNHIKYCDQADLRGATVIKFIDKGHVQISKKATHDAVMYGLVIRPPDYIDMCDCTVGGGQ